MNRFWNWEDGEETRTLTIDGVIASESWYDDEISPQIFRAELNAGKGPVELYINSPGGDCIAASQIYTMLQEYPGKVTVKIDGLAASAASVIAMAGEEVQMAAPALMMIHNPWTISMGDAKEMQHTIDMLDEVKEAIVNAYQRKSGLSRAKLRTMMDDETWLNATKAIELRLADSIIGDNAPAAMAFSERARSLALYNKINPAPPISADGRKRKLNLLKLK